MCFFHRIVDWQRMAVDGSEPVGVCLGQSIIESCTPANVMSEFILFWPLTKWATSLLAFLRGTQSSLVGEGEPRLVHRSIKRQEEKT